MVLKKSGQIQPEIHLIKLDNSDFYHKKSSAFFQSSITPPKNTNTKNRILSAKANMVKYKLIREVLMFTCALIYLFSMLNYNLNYTPPISKNVNSLIFMSVSILFHAIAFTLYFLLIYTYANVLSDLNLSKAHITKFYVLRKMLKIGGLFLSIPVPALSAYTDVFLESYFDQNSYIFSFNRDLNQYLFLIEISVAFFGFFYFFGETRQNFNIRSFRIHRNFGMSVNFKTTIKENFSQHTFFSTLFFYFCGIFYLSTLLMFSETGMSIYMQNSGDYRQTFLTGNINTQLKLNYFSNSLWFSMTTISGFSSSDFIVFSNLSKIILLIAIGFLFCFFRFCVDLVFKIFKSEKKQLMLYPYCFNPIVREEFKNSAADLIKVFFFKFLVFRKSNNKKELLDVENKFIVASLRFRKVKTRVRNSQNDSAWYETLHEDIRFKKNIFLIDKVLEYAKERKRKTKPGNNETFFV